MVTMVLLFAQMVWFTGSLLRTSLLLSWSGRFDLSCSVPLFRRNVLVVYQNIVFFVFASLVDHSHFGNICYLFQIYHKMNLCINCKIRFRTVQELYEHEKIHLPKLDVLPFACSRCDMAFSKISDITVHIRAVHKPTVVEEVVQSYQSPRQVSVTVKPSSKYTKHPTGNVKQNPTKKVKLKN